MPAAAARVSTLLTTVGFLYNPSVTGNGGLTSTSALRPSIEAIRAVSSPQMYAPCPIQIPKSKEKFVPKIFSPSKPSFLRELIDAFNDSIDFGYSPLIYKTPSSLPMTYPQTVSYTHLTLPTIYSV